MDYNDEDVYYSENEFLSEDEDGFYKKEPVYDIYEYDEKVIDIFKDIKQYVKNENIFICEMLKIDDVYDILNK